MTRRLVMAASVTFLLVEVPRIDQLNVVVADVVAAVRFLTDLGVDTPGSMTDWEQHHQPIPASTSPYGGHEIGEPTFGIDIDSSAFARWWGGLPSSFTGAVLNVRVGERGDVDELHERGVLSGGRSLKAPHDAFWGSRYAVVEGPGPIIVGLMSVPDETRRHPPPDPHSLT
jgi:hypothetical protein